MFKMIEVVGTSAKGFSEAVSDAIAHIVSDGKSPHWFEIVEQRGAVRGGKTLEFQVKLKVGISPVENKKKETAAADTQEYCPTCQEPIHEGGHLCVPSTLADHKCEWCGALIPDERHLCSDKVKELAYICNSCGRTAISPEHLCNPKKIEK